MVRAHQTGEKPDVSVYRFVSIDTMEEDVLERAKKKMVLEYTSMCQPPPSFSPADAGAPVINQLDTSQAYPSFKANAYQPGNLSKDELTAVLKYGAHKM
jgi:chromodomain-helicase-DNA-binding protein 1